MVVPSGNCISSWLSWSDSCHHLTCKPRWPSSLCSCSSWISPLSLCPVFPPQHGREVESRWLVSCPALVPYGRDEVPEWRRLCRLKGPGWWEASVGKQLCFSSSSSSQLLSLCWPHGDGSEPPVTPPSPMCAAGSCHLASLSLCSMLRTAACTPQNPAVGCSACSLQRNFSSCAVGPAPLAGFIKGEPGPCASMPCGISRTCI